MHKRNFAGPTAAVVAILVAVTAPASAQAPDAQVRCEPDVMRLCSEFVPDRNRIVRCLKVKRRQLSASCLRALQGKPQTTGKERRQR